MSLPDFFSNDCHPNLKIGVTKASNELNGIKLMFSKMVAHQIQAHIMIFKTGSLEL
jgi:hypothetical protein